MEKRTSDKNNNKFPDETIAALVELGAIFNKIRKRMYVQGYAIVGGKIKKICKGRKS